jgi:hypothetical protein
MTPAEDRLVFKLKNEPGYLDGTTFRDSDLSTVPKDTVFLNLENARITDDGIVAMPDLPRLRCVDLDSTGITDAALQRLGGFPNLEEIWIEDTAVTDKGLAYLYGLRRLRFISILDCAISDEAVNGLRRAIPGVEVH